MPWVLAHKDLNHFWPVGLPVAGTALGGAFAEVFERGLEDRPLSAAVRNPTALLLLLLYSTYGMREAHWPRERRLRYAGRLFAMLHASKDNDVLNSDGKHQLRSPRLPASAAAVWREPTPPLVGSASALCAAIWACSEALFFCNHRIGTERHGPYVTDRPGTTLVVRSAFDLAPRELWPEIVTWPVLPQAFHITFECEAAETRFDMFANPLSEYRIQDVTRRVAVLCVQANGSERWDGSVSEIRAWAASLRELVRDVTRIVATLTERERILRLHRIMLYGARTVAGADVALAAPVSFGDGHRVVGAGPELERYYDLRCDLGR
jgi:hypothetical protein